jgi:hypothetical protein
MLYIYSSILVQYTITYTRDGKLEVTRGPIFRKFKSSGPEHRKKKKKKVIQNFN